MPLLEEELNTATNEDTLFHEEALLVIATADTNHIVCVCVCVCVCVQSYRDAKNIYRIRPHKGREIRSCDWSNPHLSLVGGISLTSATHLSF